MWSSTRRPPLCTSELETDGSVLRVTARDDGVGGADPGRGSGLLGLIDRVHALGGRIDITSPIGSGTTLVVTLPLDRVEQPSATESP